MQLNNEKTQRDTTNFRERWHVYNKQQHLQYHSFNQYLCHYTAERVNLHESEKVPIQTKGG